ncbi:MAG TPA: glycosyltransferase [Candidatus Acidoferrales bacterium]|nr:glycosyltransferase [Candidatus Acidoferrales bacterium]
MDNSILSRDIPDLHSYIRWNSISKYIDDSILTLDVGCNVGTMSIEMAKRCSGKVVGIDVDPKVIAKAQQRAASFGLSNCEFMPASATELPFANATFDRILLADVLEHVIDDLGIIKECFRVMKPGGKLIINAPRPNYSTLFNKAWIRSIGHVRDGYELDDIKGLTSGLFDVVEFDFNSRAKEEFDAFYNKGFQKITDERVQKTIELESDLSREPYGLSVMLIRKNDAAPVTRKIRVLHVAWGHPPNMAAGPIYYLHHLSLRQKANGLDVACFVAGQAPQKSGQPPYIDDDIIDGLKYFKVENRPAHYFDWSNPRRETENKEIENLFQNVLQKWQPDIVHFHNLVGLSMSLPIIAKKFDAATVLSAHNYWMMCSRDDLFATNESSCQGPGDGSPCASCIGNPDAVDDLMYRTSKSKEILNNHVDLVLAVSERVRELFIEFGMPANKIVTQHIGSIAAEVNWNNLGKNNKHRSKPNTPVRLAYFGTLSLRKGVHLILEAAKHLKEYEGQFIIEIYGGGINESYRARLENILRSEPFLNRVIIFKGGYTQQNLPALMCDIDAVIIPPLWEDNGPQTVMETLGAGIPIIGARMGGIPDFVTDGENGLLFRGGDPLDLAAAIKKILGDPAVLAKFRNGIHAPLPMEQHVYDLHEKYLELLKGKAPRVIDSEEHRELYNAARTMIESGNAPKAFEILRKLLQTSPEHAAGHNDIGVLYFQRGEIQPAKRHLQRSISVAPNYIIAQKNLAEVYAAEGNFQTALALLQKIFSENSQDTEPLISIANICLRIGKKEEAVFFYNKVLGMSSKPEIKKEILQILGALDANADRSKAGEMKHRPNAETPAASVSVIVLAYNKLEFTGRCIQSILSRVHYGNYEIIVVDNASTDGTREFMLNLSRKVGNLKYVRNETNVGFVGGCNVGVEHASGEYVLLLNNDTVVTEGWLESLIEFAIKTPDCGAVGSKLIYPDGRLQEAGGIIFSDGNGWNYGKGMDPTHPKFNFVREVDYVSGASLMVRRDLWNKIGGLDKLFYPAYFEDSDLCFEIRKRGYKVYYEPHSVAIHYEGTTAGTDLNAGVKQFQLINKPKFIEKWKSELREQFPYEIRNVENASSRGIEKRILVIDPYLPLFDRAAGSLHLFNILKILRKMNYHITFISANGDLKARYLPILEEMGIETFAGDPDLTGNTRDRKIDYQKLFQERQFDFALIDFWYLAEYYLPMIKKFSPLTTVIIDTEDVHFVREMREAELKNDIELKKTAVENKKRELAVYSKTDKLWVVTEEDKRALAQELSNKPIEIRPVIHEMREVQKGFENRSGILFVGNFNHTPNADAVEFFLKEIFPLVLNSLPDVQLYVVGNNSRKIFRSLNSNNVTIVDYVEDLSEYYEKCRISIAPLRYGAGLKGKIIESLSYGVPVVTTSIGAEGTELQGGREIIIADDPTEMAGKIVRVLSDGEFWEMLSKNGLKRMQERWSFTAGERRLREILSPPPKHEKSQTDKSTSIIILTYNQLKYTKITLDSIRKHTKVPYEIIVVDNASSDGTVEYLKTQRDLQIILNEENLGFPAGCNQGIERANGDYIVLLNNDVVVPNNWLEGLVECAESDPKTGVVGPMSNWISGYQLEKNFTYKRVSQLDEFAADYRRRNRKRWIEVPRIAGFCMLIKKDVIDKIGGLDTAYGMGNCEDDDFCVRSNLAGFRNFIAGDVFVHHFGSKSFMNDGFEKFQEVLEEKKAVFQDKWGITPSERWMEKKEIQKRSSVYVPLRMKETTLV